MAVGGRAVRTGKGGPKSVPTPGIRPQMVLGSRPPTMRSPALPNPMTGSMRIKPLAGQTQYGKTPMPPPAGPLGVGG